MRLLQFPIDVSILGAMTKAEALKFFNESQSELARALGIRQPSVSAWGAEIPALRQIQLERVTCGKLKADPSCYLPAHKPDGAVIGERA